ncbi:MAG TPA: sugar phosphate isomerase/epimerase [Bacteroidales bacterium]|nr:sugar phosphate isomerase/epimerase [Bacteroidales bacterium]
MKRRTFVKTTSAGLLAGLIFPSRLLASVPPGQTIGLQLYSLRDEISKDLEGSLQKIAAIGYETVEAAGYSKGKFYGMEPGAFKNLVHKCGLKVTSSHLTFNHEEIPEVLKAHKDAGINYLVWPWIGQDDRQSIDNYKRLAEKFNSIGMICLDNGLRFGYHNHDFEFHAIDGIIPYDILLESTDPKFVFMQLDLYWITYAGLDPVSYFKKYPGRFLQWHVKDMRAGEEKKMTEVGTGIIDYKNLFANSAAAGLKAFFVEQDEIEGDGFESVKISHDNLRVMLG